MPVDINFLLVEPNADRSLDIIDAFNDSGWPDATMIADAAALVCTLRQYGSDFVLVDPADSDRDTLEYMSVVSDARSRPVAEFAPIVLDGDFELDDHRPGSGDSQSFIRGLVGFRNGSLAKGMLDSAGIATFADHFCPCLAK